MSSTGSHRLNVGYIVRHNKCAPRAATGLVTRMPFVDSPQAIRAAVALKLTAALAALSIIAGLVLASPAAANGPTCRGGSHDGSRPWAETLARRGQFGVARFGDGAGPSGWIKAPNGVGGWSYYKIELRYDRTTQCAWALFSGQPGNEFFYGLPVWIDRSLDRGRSMSQTFLGRTRAGWSGAAYTGVFDDASPYVVRACADIRVRGRIRPWCTGWY